MEPTIKACDYEVDCFFDYLQNEELIELISNTVCTVVYIAEVPRNDFIITALGKLI